MDLIRTRNISKHFGRTKALDKITIQVGHNEIYGFLGLNGAGKTSLIRILLGMITPAEGEVYLLGKKLSRNYSHWNEIGYLVETPLSYPNLSVYENLLLIYHLRQLRNKSEIDSIIDQLQLTNYRNTKAKNLSLGNQQRLGLAKALIHKPKLLILDEPINGLDPAGIAEIRNLLTGLAENGTSVFLSSHILSEISKIAHRIGIIHKGYMVEELSNAELNAKLERKLLIKTGEPAKARDFLSDNGFNVHLSVSGDLEITGAISPEDAAKLNEELVQSGMPPSMLLPYTEDLEDFFLRTINTKNVPGT